MPSIQNRRDRYVFHSRRNPLVFAKYGPFVTSLDARHPKVVGSGKLPGECNLQIGLFNRGNRACNCYTIPLGLYISSCNADYKTQQRFIRARNAGPGFS